MVGHIDVYSYSYAAVGNQKSIDRGLYDQIRTDDVRLQQFPFVINGDDWLVPAGKFYYEGIPTTSIGNIGQRFQGPQKNTTSDAHFLRISEIYLLHAEASFEIGEINDAVNSLKAIADLRIADTSYINDLSGSALGDEINLQTRIELFGEGKSYLNFKRQQRTLTRGSNWLDLAGESFSYDDQRLVFNARHGNSSLLQGFKTTWRINSSGQQVVIYTNPEYNYNYSIDWGDGNIEYNVTGDTAHTYLDSGDYTIAINGTFPHFLASGIDGSNDFNGEKLISVNSLGELNFSSFENSFSNTSLNSFTWRHGMFDNVSTTKNMFSDSEFLNLYIPYNLNTSSIVNMSGMFKNINKLSDTNEYLKNWDVSNVIDMSNMFNGAGSFNGDLSNWDMNSNVILHGFISNTAMSSFNYEKLLKKLNDSQIMNKTLGAHGLKYSFDQDRISLISKSWTINGDQRIVIDPNAFVFEISINENTGMDITLNNYENEKNWDYVVNWGDGTSSAHDTVDANHTYENSGNYIISIIGNFFNISYVPITVVHSWGNINWDTMNQMFSQSLQKLPENSVPNLSGVTDMSSMFRYAENFNSDISNWDVSNVTDMSSMFFGAGNFNSDISNWDVSNVTDMSYMFGSAENFNSDISDWDVSNVTDMSNMFFYARNFNGDLSNWGVSNVTNMSDMFRLAENFNQSLENWQFNSAVSLGGFVSNSGLNKNNYENLLQRFVERNLTDKEFISNDLLYCEDIYRNYLLQYNNWTILGDTSWCGDFESEDFILTWETDKLTIYTHEGDDYYYNVDWGDGNISVGVSGDISHQYSSYSTYDVVISGDFPGFKNSIFGLDGRLINHNSSLKYVKNWGTNQWQSFKESFRLAGNITILDGNMPNLSNVVSMDYMFWNSSIAGEYDFGSWDVSNVTSMKNIFGYLSTKNYDNLLKGWSQQNLRFGVYFSLNASYCDESSRDILTGFQWEIIDNGLSNECESLSINDSLGTNISIYVYPNPTPNKIHVIANNIISVDLFDSMGRILKSTQKNQIDLSDMGIGTFLLKVTADDNKTKSFKIIRQ